MTFKKGSTRHKILEGLGELKMDSVLEFMKVYGSREVSRKITMIGF